MPMTLHFEVDGLLLGHFSTLNAGSVGKESACNAEDPALTPGSGRSSGEGTGNPLAWEIPWTEEPGGLQSMGSQELTRLND